MIKCIVFVTALAACDTTPEQAVEYLAATDRGGATCVSQGYQQARCSVGGVQYRCVTTSAQGCNRSAAVACEPLLVEAPR